MEKQGIYINISIDDNIDDMKVEYVHLKKILYFHRVSGVIKRLVESLIKTNCDHLPK